MSAPRVVVLGGGIAGLSLAIALRARGLEAQVYERKERRTGDGLGLLLLAAGREALAGLGIDVEAVAGAHPVGGVRVYEPAGGVLLEASLRLAHGVRRAPLIAALRAALPADWVHSGATFSTFERGSDGRVQAARFEEGLRVEGDLFVGCDGARSRVRGVLFPGTGSHPLGVSELVGLATCPGIGRALHGYLHKGLSPEGGFAAGTLPCGVDEAIVYVQFDPHRHPLDMRGNPEVKRAFALSRVAE